MAVDILYTESDVENAQLRAQVALALISQQIENGFYYLYSPVYPTYKALQYDIYTLFNVIGNELPFITFNPNPTQYEKGFYGLVGSLINKTKQFDVYGQYGGSTNPNYQPPTGIIVVPGGNPQDSGYRKPLVLDINSPGWDVGGDQYINTSLAGLNSFQVFINSVGRYATNALDGFQHLTGGGFSFDPAKFVLLSGDVLIVIF